MNTILYRIFAIEKTKLLAKALPEKFLNSIKELPGYNEEAFVHLHEQTQQITSVRLNIQKPTGAISELPIESNVPWCAAGKYLSQRPSFTSDPVFHGGAYYVQEASSMFLDHVVKEICKDEQSPKRVLDLCAAPGGKSTLLAAALPDSFIVSNEVIKTRVNVLAENISKWGSDNVVVTNNDARDFKRLPGYFDLLVIDAPCSGSGLFRKDNDAIDEWSEANVEMCSLRQKRIIADAIDALKEGGHLIYSTCSYSRQENEDVCDWIAEQFRLQSAPVSIDSEWEIVETFSEKHHVAGYRFYPDKVQGEGFFLACFRQPNLVDEYASSNSNPSVSKQVKLLVDPYIKNSPEYLLSDQKEMVIACLKKWEAEVSATLKTLNVRKSGVAIGTVKGKDFIPHHELALSHLLSPEIPFVNLNKEAALQYLKRQEFQPEDSRKGWIICSYEHIHLGWMKVLPNRVNNYYPTNWRILKA